MFASRFSTAPIPDFYTPGQPPPDRSAQSRAFEAMWRGLARDGLIPKRSAFLPERAAKLLPHIALIEVHPCAPMTTRIRLVGNALRMLADMDVTGLDFLDMVADRAYHAERMRKCMQHPCGNWSAAPIVYERGYKSLIEITNLPLIDDQTGGRLALALIYEICSDLPEHRTIGKPIELHPAVVNGYIDIGAGMPETDTATS